YAPQIPDMPTISNYCNSTRLTRGNPPIGEVWYWQNSPTGGVIGDSSEFVDRSSGTTYYLQSYNSTKNSWSGVRTINYTVTSDDCESTNKNYIRTITPLIPTNNTTLLANDKKIESISFFDGLGKSRQILNKRAGGQQQD